MATTTESFHYADIIHDWNKIEQKELRFLEPVELCDETLRDGLQSPSVRDPDIKEKFRFVELMDRLGVTIADIGLPGAGPRARQDVLQIAKYVRDQRLRLKVNCAARTVLDDIQPIADIQNAVGIPVAAYCFLGTSPIRQYVEEWDLDKLLTTADKAISFALKENLDVAFVTEDTIRSSPETLESLFKRVIDLGCRRLVLCDTVGHATPEGVRNLVCWTKQLVQKTGEDVKLEWHGHNDRGLAVTNSLYAAAYGCQRIHGTCLGVGERVGNASIDQIMVNLKLLGQYPHDLSALAEYAALTATACEVPLPYNYPVFGKDAFRTATGVHAAAVIKAQKKGDALLADTIYSGVPAHWFGRKQEIEIGPMSGISNVRYWLQKNGFSEEPSLASSILELAKKSDHTLTDAQIRSVIEHHQSQLVVT